VSHSRDIFSEQDVSAKHTLRERTTSRDL